MPSNWAKGFTKYTHPSLLKMSETIKRKKIDNFAKWRIWAKAKGIMKAEYPVFKKDGDLAELIGVVYGDGNIGRFPRSERLIITSNSNNKGFINRYSCLVKKIFNKETTNMKSPNSNYARISIYENKISERLGVPAGDRSNLKIAIPLWIKNDHKILKRFLRGLFEAEGSFCVHKPTGTYKFLFSNRNASLLNIVFDCLKILSFHPHRSSDKIQISKKSRLTKQKSYYNFESIKYCGVDKRYIVTLWT